MRRWRGLILPALLLAVAEIAGRAAGPSDTVAPPSIQSIGIGSRIRTALAERQFKSLISISFQYAIGRNSLTSSQRIQLTYSIQLGHSKTQTSIRRLVAASLMQQLNWLEADRKEIAPLTRTPLSDGSSRLIGLTRAGA